MKINFLISKTICKKLVLLATLAAITCGAFATLGDGHSKNGKSARPLLSVKTSVNPGLFSLESGYRFRGNQVINTQEEKYINLNTVVTYQQGRTTYVMPLKKKVILFFFQAEDGIRDGTVTGVQTCALPISPIGSRESRGRCGHTIATSRPGRSPPKLSVSSQAASRRRDGTTGHTGAPRVENKPGQIGRASCRERE